MEIKKLNAKSYNNIHNAVTTAQKLYYNLTNALSKFEKSDNILGEVIIGMGYG